jgi:acyl-CoA dehydrogenase
MPVKNQSPPRWCVGDLAQAAWTVGAEVAAQHADDVDRQARFPREAADAMAAAGLLSAMVPVELGGAGASLESAALATRALAAHCSATALVFSMHQINVWYLSRYGHTDTLRDLLGQVVSDGVLIANGNSEVGLGGDVGQSICAVESADGRFTLTKEALALSYGADADALVLTARRAPDAEPNDQVLLAARPGTFTLERTSEWDTTGLRGTCSSSFHIEIDESCDAIVPVPWSTIGPEAVGVTVILLNSVWLGIAEAAASLAHAYVRADARKKIGTTPASAPLLAEISVLLDGARAAVAAVIDAYEAAGASDSMQAPSLLLAVRNLKLSSTTSAIEIVLLASRICGLMGYKRDSPYSLDRHLRDVMGGPLMANNTRAAGDNARLLVALKEL